MIVDDFVQKVLDKENKKQFSLNKREDIFSLKVTYAVILAL